MKSCRVRGCEDPPGVLVAWVEEGNQTWHACLRHFWPMVHKLLDRGVERVIVSGMPGCLPVAVSIPTASEQRAHT